MKIKATITINRASNGLVYIRLNDEASHIEFVDVAMTPHDFAEAVMGLAMQPVEGEVRGLENVGKNKIYEKRSIVCPLDTHKTSELVEWLRLNAQEEGWILDTYLGSQTSVGPYKEGGRRLNYAVIKYVEAGDE